MSDDGSTHESYKVGDLVIFKGCMRIAGKAVVAGRWPTGSPVAVVREKTVAVLREGKLYWFPTDEVEHANR